METSSKAPVVTLIPYPIEGDMRNADAVRARVEREVFMLGSRRTAPVAALPLAMVGLAGDAVLWLDPYLVRREIGLEHRDVLGLGFAPRALREAHLLQYQRRLAEIDVPGPTQLSRYDLFRRVAAGRAAAQERDRHRRLQSELFSRRKWTSIWR
jgi:hypothetical protein